jgi:hypothetical protein
MVTQVVKLEDKAVKQEIAYRQQIMAWSQNKSHVSLRRMATNAVRLRCSGLNLVEWEIFFIKTLLKMYCNSFLT